MSGGAFTKYAKTYADQLENSRQFGEATFEDVARAYDAGLEHGVMNRHNARRALKELPTGIGAWDTTGFRRR